MDSGLITDQRPEPRIRRGIGIRILLADDQPVVRFALRVLLECQPGVVVVGEAWDVPGLLDAAEAGSPHLVLLDWELPGMGAATVLAALRKARPDLLVIALSGRPEAQPAALAEGVNAFVSKSDPPDSLLAAIGELVY